MSIRYVATLGASIATLTVYGLPDTYFLENVRKIKAKYRWDGVEEPVTEKLQKRFQEVLQVLPFKPEEKKLLRIFHIYGYDMFHAGTVATKHGGVVGIPLHFQYENVESINKDEAFFYDKPVDWNRQAAKNFLNALVLSEDAQKFAIAREALKIKQNNALYNAFNGLIHVVLSFAVYDILHKMLHLEKRTRGLRYTIIATVAVGSIGTWIATHYATIYATDMSADEAASSLGQNYLKGGQEYYEKLLNRNIALRTLLGDEGKKLFTANGNETYIFMQKSVPIFNRKSIFDSKLQNVEQLV